MTYTEVKKFENDNWDSVCPTMVGSTPAHLREGTLIAPKHSNLNTLVQIFSFIEDNKLPNDEVLKQMGLLGNNLELYIIFKTQGYTNILPFEVYKSIEWWFKDDTGKDSK